MTEIVMVAVAAIICVWLLSRPLVVLAEARSFRLMAIETEILKLSGRLQELGDLRGLTEGLSELSSGLQTTREHVDEIMAELSKRKLGRAL